MTAQIPAWPFLVLAALVTIGVLQSRAREVALAAILGVGAAMAAWSLGGIVVSFGFAPVPLAGWALGMGIAVLGGSGSRTRAGIVKVAGRGRVRMPGSWWPMTLMLGIFAVRFALGFAAGIGAPVDGHSTTAAFAGLALGLLSGGFAARSLAVLRVARTTAADA